MDITPLIPKEVQVINSYGAGGFVINNIRYEGSVIVFPDEVVSWIGTGVEQIIARSSQIEILLVGTGKEIKPLDQKIKSELKSLRISFDIMDTGAACRTYNVLISEERKVAVVLTAL